MMARKLLCFIGLLSFVFLGLKAQEWVDGAVVSEQGIESDDAVNDYIHFYQYHLSALKQSQCPMYPSCSNYGLMVYRDYPFFKATTMLADRMIRCSHDGEYYPITYAYGRRSLVDYPGADIPDGILYSEELSPKTDFLKYHENDTILFVNYLINNSDYISALYKIRESEFINHGISEELFAKKLLCFRGLKQFEEGVFCFDNEYPQYHENLEVGLQAGMLHYSLGNYDRVIELFSSSRVSDDVSVNEKKEILSALSNAQLGNYSAAFLCFDSARCYGNTAFEVNNQLLTQLQSQHYKNPSVARALSIVPGLGYLYSGHYGSALTSLIMNCALGYATYTSIKSENYGVAGLCGLLSLSFYIGNISGAGKSAVRYNDIRKKEILLELENSNHIFIY